MKSFFLFLTLILTVALAQATIRRVAKDGSGDYTIIQAAVDASPAGDTVVVMGDLGPYTAGASVIRQITILGQGNGCSNVPGTQIDASIDFNAGSSGSVCEGLILNTGRIIVHTNIIGISVRRCRFIQSGSAIDLYSGSSANVVECAIDGANECVYFRGSSASLSLRNTILMNTGEGIDGLDDLSCSASIENCIFVDLGVPITGGQNWSINHCVFWDCGTWNGAISGYVIAGYNVMQSSMTAFPFVAGVDSVILTNPFVSYNEPANYQPCVSDLHLPPNSGLINRGDPNAASDRDGTRRDIGLYGGPNPYVDSGAPDFPFVTQFFVPATVPQNGVLEIRSTGRVGQGGGQ